jgi:hypothetical protein
MEQPEGLIIPGQESRVVVSTSAYMDSIQHPMSGETSLPILLNIMAFKGAKLTHPSFPEYAEQK